MMLVPTKKLWTSKLFWLALGIAVLAILDFIDTLDLPAAERVLAFLAPVIIILRVYTKQPVTVTGQTTMKSVPPAGQ